jgi:glycosyltransferase involved in cell wall biosynthesis
MVVKIQSLPAGSEGAARGVGFYTRSLVQALRRHVPGLTVLYHSSQSPAGPEAETTTYDLVHYPFFDFFFHTLPAHHSVPAVATVHDLIPLLFPKRFPAGIKGRLNWWFQRRSLRRLDLIITDSQTSKRDLVRELGLDEKKIRVVYLAADPAFKRVADAKKLDEVRQRYGLPDRFALYVGDLNWNKNPLGLAAVCRRLRIPLVVVGKAAKEMPADPSNVWNQERVAFIKAAGKSEQIFTPGFVAVEDLAAVYSLARVYLQLSFYEGFGLPVLEAMRCGCPVVAGETGSLPEIGGEAAIFVDPTDLDGTAAVIERVWRDEELRERMRTKGTERAAWYSWEKTAKETAAVYQEALEASGGGFKRGRWESKSH